MSIYGPVFETLLRKLQEDADTSAQFLANGSAKSYEEYREVTGRIRGLRLAAQTVKDLMRNLTEHDDDDE